MLNICLRISTFLKLKFIHLLHDDECSVNSVPWLLNDHHSSHMIRSQPASVLYVLMYTNRSLLLLSQSLNLCLPVLFMSFEFWIVVFVCADVYKSVTSSDSLLMLAQSLNFCLSVLAMSFEFWIVVFVCVDIYKPVPELECLFVCICICLHLYWW